MELLLFDKSNRKNKKWVMVFKLKNGRTKTIHFGDSRYDDYTIHKDDERKKRYLARHKNEDWTKLSAGTLSRYILWNKRTIKASLEDFKKKFFF